MQRQIKRVLIPRSPRHLHLQTLTQIYGAPYAAVFWAVLFNGPQPATERDSLALRPFGLTREEGKRLHWKRGVRWHHTVCQLCHRAKRETPWWLAEGRIAEPLCERRVPRAAELLSLDVTLLVEHEAKTEEFFIMHAGIVTFIVEYQVGLFFFFCQIKL